MRAAELDITVDRRVPFNDFVPFLDEDWTGSTFKIQVRLTQDTTTTPLIDATSPSGVGLAYAGTATVATHISAARLTNGIYEEINPATGTYYASSDNLVLSVLIFFLTFSTFPFPEERGDDLTTYYDIVRTPSGVSPVQEIVLSGKMIVSAGVTIP